MKENKPITDDLGFDPDALKKKYREERDKRIRPDGKKQYQEMVGEFSNYVDDPYILEKINRAPLNDEKTVVVIGGGFAGLLMIVRLKEAGIKNIRLIEKGGDIGGTWYWNRYPGAACDTESYVYMPLCEELNYIPTKKYAYAPEIYEHCQRIAKHYDIYDIACLQTEVTDMEWDSSISRWIIKTNNRDAMRAQFVIMCNGPFNRPKLPGIPGISTFKGHTFHTSRWDYEYTGGNVDGNLENLQDKKVGIIGTGASSIQCIPHLGTSAKELYVFQRTPSSIDRRDNRPTDPEWASSLQPGWQKERMDNFNAITSGRLVEKDLVMDGWTEIITNLVSMAKFRGTKINPAEIPALMELEDFKKMESIRARVDAFVEDPKTAAALKPYYRQFCKRPCFHDEYLPTFNRKNVFLIDTDGKGVQSINEKGVLANDQFYEVDCLIFATGFEVGTGYTTRSGYDPIGKNGLRLSEKWKAGIRTLHSFHVQGFPNLFVVGHAQGSYTTSYTHSYDIKAQHLSYIIGECQKKEAREVEASLEAEQAWVDEIIRVHRNQEKFNAECTPGYYNNEGHPSDTFVLNSAYGKGPIPFFKIIQAWRKEGSMKGLVLKK